MVKMANAGDLHTGIAVEDSRGRLGIVTATHYSRGKEKVLVSCGVMFLGAPYEVRTSPDSLKRVTLGKI